MPTHSKSMLYLLVFPFDFSHQTKVVSWNININCTSLPMSCLICDIYALNLMLFYKVFPKCIFHCQLKPNRSCVNIDPNGLALCVNFIFKPIDPPFLLFNFLFIKEWVSTSLWMMVLYCHMYPGRRQLRPASHSSLDYRHRRPTQLPRPRLPPPLPTLTCTPAAHRAAINDSADPHLFPDRQQPGVLNSSRF